MRNDWISQAVYNYMHYLLVGFQPAAFVNMSMAFFHARFIGLS